jgi:general secretion pathway protein B
MSFILDALKKAESERSRNAGPVLMDVRVAPPRQRLPAWAWIMGVVLLANLLVLAWLLLRKPAPPPVAAATIQAAPTAPAAPAAPVPAPVVPEPAALPPAPVIAQPSAIADPALAPAPGAVTQPPASAPVYQALPRIDNLPTAQDLIAEGIPLPALILNLHVYDEAPANRYVLLNARRLREGDEVADGVRVVTIVPRGVVLITRGRRFVVLAGS